MLRSRYARSGHPRTPICFHRMSLPLFLWPALALSSLVSTASGQSGAPARPAPDQAVPVEVKDMTITQAGVAVVLVSDETAQELPLMIGTAEGQAIVRALRHARMPRPMTHDLMKTLVELGGWQVSRVIIRDLRDHTYFADIVLVRPGEFGIEGNVEEKTIDARPSDAMALGLRFDAPIYVRQKVFDLEREQRDVPSPSDPPSRPRQKPESVTI